MTVVSGTVYDHGPFGRRPLAGVPLFIVPGPSAPVATSDADGRYRIAAPSGVNLFVRALSGPYRQPCPSAAVLAGETTVDVHLVAGEVLATSGIPASMPIAPPHVSGRVLDVTDSHETPMPGVVVSGTVPLQGTAGISVETVSDGAGRYLLCGAGASMDLFVFVDGYPSRIVATIDFTKTPVATGDIRLRRFD